MPSRLHVRITRQAISPRLAIRIFSNGGLTGDAPASGFAFAARAAAGRAVFRLAVRALVRACLGVRRELMRTATIAMKSMACHGLNGPSTSRLYGRVTNGRVNGRRRRE